ncbi:hypothetical protein Chor_011717 [Crotalus horridus]
MPPCPACLLVLGAALGVSVPGDCCGSPSHFLRYSYLHLSEPSRFFVWGKLDDQPIMHFDSLIGRVETLVCWMEEVKEGTFLPVEWVFRSDLENLSNLNNLNEEGKVTHKLINDSQEILVCEAYGFYPKQIQVNWTRDGENLEQGIIRRNVTPNSDGTYYVWIGIKINPEERNRMWRRHLLDMWRRCRRIRYQEVRSSLGDIPLENVSVSSPSGTEDDIQSESLLQSEVTLEDTALSDLEVSASTLRRREGKQQKLQRSQSWDLEARDKAGGTWPTMAGHSWPQPNRLAWTHSERNTEFNHL